MNKELNYFQKFIYLTAVQLILVSQLLVVAGSLASPVSAESGSGSEGQTVETVSEDNSGSGSATQEPATTDTQDNSGTGSSGQDTQATTDSNSGTGNTDQQVVSEEPTTGGEVTAVEGEAGTIVDEVVEEPAPTTDTVTGVEEPVVEGETADILGDTVNVAPEGTAPEGTPTTILEQTTVPAAGEIDPATGFPVSYQDATGVAVVPCLDGTDPGCVLPGAGEEPNFDPSQPTELGTNFPSEFFYWIAESDLLDTPNGGKTFIRTALEGAFLNEEPLAGDQMVFGRIRVTGTGLEPNSEYTVTHPYGVDTYVTDEEGIVKRGEGTEDIGCFGAPCNFAEAVGSRVFENFLRWDSGAPVGTLGDAVTPHTVVGSPLGQNFFRIEGPGLPFEGLFTNLFTVAGKLLSGEFVPGAPTGGETVAEIAPGLSEAGVVDEAIGFPVSYQDATGVAVVPCLDGTDPGCVLPGAGEEPNFDPSQPTELGTNFPSEFFYWIAESDLLDTPNGGKTMFRMALEGAFLNDEPIPGDQMVFGRLRLTGTGLEPNSVYTVTHPYGVDTYTTSEEGIVVRGEGTEDIGCFGAPCNFAAALQSRVFEGFLQGVNAPAGYLGDAVSLTEVIGSPLGQNFFRIEGPGLPLGGLFTNLFTVAGKLLSETVLPIIGGAVTDGDTPDAADAAPAEEPVVAPDPVAETDVVEPVIDTDLPADEVAEDLVTEDTGTEVPPVEEEDIAQEEVANEDDNVVAGNPEITIDTLPDGNLTLTTELLASSQSTEDSSSSADGSLAVEGTASNSGGASTTESSDNSSGQDNGNQTQVAASGSSDDNSGSRSSGSTSGISGGGSEDELRGSIAEGELPGVDEELDDTSVLGLQDSVVSEGSLSENIADIQDPVVVAGDIQQPERDPIEVLLALAALAIAGGIFSRSAFAGLSLQRHPHTKIRGLRLR